ncbi:MAG: TonB-dependent receptor [Bacteroidetes bacterium]|nr:TonB-dependent receptor [Bacteroidota bacterium]
MYLIFFVKTLHSFLHITILSLLSAATSAQQDSAAAQISEGVRNLDEVVVTATRTARRRSESPLLVRVLDRRSLQSLPAMALSDALSYQPGLRVEVACQTCNYTQLRMNGLPGAYSQVLVDGRPLFSPLLGLYGLEQLPTELIEKVEVLRGGGSSLYGSAAIAGTVNIITRQPERSGTTMQTQYQRVGEQSGDLTASLRSSQVRADGKAGMSFIANRRQRQWFDANDDGYSETPRARSGMAGWNAFLQPGAGKRLQASLTYLQEYRRGGEMTSEPVVAAAQAEERDYGTWTGSADYRQSLRGSQAVYTAYIGWQQVRRAHYTGILPTEDKALAAHLANPPVGGSRSHTLQAGTQLNLQLARDSLQKHVLTIGTEWLREAIADTIPAYQFQVRQTTSDLGVFAQSDWSPHPRWTLLTGLRADLHNLIPGRALLSPRTALLYRPIPSQQLRVGYGAGFRAPQAFDTDLHMAFASGGVSRIQIAPGLREERSQSLHLSWNADHAHSNRIFGYTLEAFFTSLQDAFALVNTGRDSVGEIFSKRNGGQASVAGLTVECRAERKGIFHWEASLTWQRSWYREPVTVADSLPPQQRFLRTPDIYGYSHFGWTLRGRWQVGLSQVYTGPMILVHFAGGSNYPSDRLARTRPFLEHHLRIDRSWMLRKGDAQIDAFLGVRNLTNQYQSDFDRGPYRDSNFIYGPSIPRSFFLGLRCRIL